MRNYTFPLAVIGVSAMILTGCSSSGDDDVPQDVKDWANEQSQSIQDDIKNSYPPSATHTPRDVVPAQLGEPVTVDPGSGPLVTVTITGVTREDSCTTSSGSSYQPRDGQFLAVDYSLEAGDTPSTTGFKFTALDADDYSLNLVPMSSCSGDSPDLNQFHAQDKVRGTYYFDAPVDAAKLRAEPRFGTKLNESLPAAWTWEIPS